MIRNGEYLRKGVTLRPEPALMYSLFWALSLLVLCLFGLLWCFPTTWGVRKLRAALGLAERLEYVSHVADVALRIV